MRQYVVQRIIPPLVTTLIFIAAFVVNITSDDSLYNIDLNVVPSMQDNSSLGSAAFIDFMNVIIICAAYIVIFWLISSRKLQIMVFLVWFIFLSWLLSLVKELMHQPRPYWFVESGIRMLEWTCYSEYGCPSGHSMLGLVLMQFIVRFFARGYTFIKKHIVWFYVLVLIMQLLVMFSRVILGMHTFNEVLMGAMCGAFAICIYYTSVECLILQYFKILITTLKKKKHLLALIVSMMACLAIQILITYVPTYNTNVFWDVISSIPACSSVKLYKSFQFKCFEDSALIMVAFGVLISLLYIQHASDLTRPLAYSRRSWKFCGKLGIMILTVLVPLVIFLNPGWDLIQTDDNNKALIIWICQNLGFLSALIMLLLATPPLCRKAGFQQYKDTEYIPLQRNSLKQVEIRQYLKDCF